SPGPQRVARAHTEEGEERSLPEPCALHVRVIATVENLVNADGSAEENTRCLPPSLPERATGVGATQTSPLSSFPMDYPLWPQAATSPGLGKVHWRAVTARKETTLFTANLQSDGVETDPSMFLPDETGNSFHRKGRVYALGAPEWGGAIWGQDKKSQPSKEGGCLGSGGFTAFLQTAENFRWPELRQAAETLRSLSRRDERGNCGVFITRQLGLREVY
ncbi:hypothetical protein EI555_001263, partial [Monodon monoceros]